MKTRFHLFLFVIIATLCATAASAQGRMFSSLCSLKGAECVYVGKALMKTIGATGIDMDGIGNVSKYLDTIEVVNLTNKSDFAKGRQAMSKVVADNNLEILTEISDDNDNMVIYGDCSGNNIKMVIINAIEPDQFAIICLKGNIPAEALSDMASGM